MRALILFGLLVGTPALAGAQDQPTRIVFIIADGAGAGHWGLAAWAGADDAIRQFPVAGLMSTEGADHVVTGSAAAATALATGERTIFGALGTGPDSLPRETLFERARAHGLATGVVTTTYIVDATPAAFITHSPTRRDWPRIFADYLRFRPEVLIGGGREIMNGPFGRNRTADARPLRQGYTYATNAAELRALDLATTDRLLGLLTDGDLPLAPERDPSLAELTRTALAVLARDPDGFVLLVENEETDTQAHRNVGIDTLVAEMRALDEAIAVALAFRARHPGTLIVVTGDHETGGLSVRGDYSGESGEIEVFYHTRGHTAEPVPLFAIGPGAEAFGGLIRNDEVGRLLKRAVAGEALSRP